MMNPGTPFESYEILALLGRGGMGEVYRARDTRLNRTVAIKFLAAEVADVVARRRFQREAQTASSLNHPHILTVFEAGESDARQYLVTEFIDGGTLKDWAHDQKRTWRQIVELLTGVADGLAVAHAAGIMHRDIKPANILVAKNGYGKLGDFGLAKLAEPGDNDATRSMVDHHTRDGFIVGTVAYMSPEQATGQPLDARTDIFSFGVVLYEALSGQRPFPATTDTLALQAIVHGTAAPLGSEVPPALRAIVEKALEKDPADRYQSMRELVVDLRRVARAKTDAVSAAPGSLVSAPSARRVWAWGGAALVLVMVAAVGGWLIRGWAPASAAPDNPLADATFTRFTDFPGTELDAAISPDGRFVAFLSDRDGPFDVWLSQVGTGAFRNLTPGPADERFNLVRSIGFSGDGSELWLGGGGVDSQRMGRLPMMGGPPHPFLGPHAVNVAWSSDGTRMAYHTRDPGDPMFVADGSGANAHQIFVDPPTGHNHYPAWSSDGQWIYFVRGIFATYEMDIWRIRPAGGEPERLTSHNSDVTYLTPIDRSTLLYAMRAEDRSGPWLWALDVETKRTRRISAGLEKYTSIAASADGRRLVATVANPTASLWSVPVLDRVAEERDVKPFPVPSVRALTPRFGGPTLFYLSSRGGGDGLWRLQDAQAFEVWKAAEGALLEPPAVSRDGRRVAVVLRRQGKLHLEAVSADGTEPQLLAESIDVRGTADWSPDSAWIVTGGNDATGPGLFKIPVAGGSPVKLWVGPAFNPVWSPSDDLIVYAGANTGTDAPLLAMRPDGTPIDLPKIRIRNDGERVRFLDGQRLVYMQGAYTWQDFWLLDLVTKKLRPLARLAHTGAMRTFDIAPDGTHIVFDRLRDNSDIVLIDRPPSPASIR